MEIVESIADIGFGDQWELTVNIACQLSWPAFLHFAAGFKEHLANVEMWL